MVYLIGAGPGHEELITVKAVRVLKNALPYYTTDWQEVMC